MLISIGHSLDLHMAIPRVPILNKANRDEQDSLASAKILSIQPLPLASHDLHARYCQRNNLQEHNQELYAT